MNQSPMCTANKGFSILREAKIFAVFLLLSIFHPVLASHPENNGGVNEEITHTEHSANANHDSAHAESHAAGHEEAYNPEEAIMHHISDAHEWEFFGTSSFHVTLPLPVILYSKEDGLKVFMSGKFAAKPGDEHNHNAAKYYGKYILFHEKVYEANAEGGLTLDAEGHPTNVMPTDLSITKNVASMILSVVILCLIFISVAKAYTKKKQLVPRGLQSFMEPLVLFVRDDVVKPNLGKNTDKFLPYMLTLFFFIWVNNMLGLLPGSANVTGNIAVTAFLALITLIFTLVFAKKAFWGHIFNPPGVPKWLFPIMIPVEIVGVFSKPFALMIRLFANITAGHLIILSILGLIFMFSDSGRAVGTGFSISVASTALSVFLYFIELLVAALQAFIFTMLTCLFLGQAMEEHHHDDEHAAEHAH